MVHLLTTNNPQNRAGIGREAGALPSLVRMVSLGTVEGASEEEVLGSEEAAEAIWILAFAGGGSTNSAAVENHEAFADHGAVSALLDAVLLAPTYKAKMWASAALGNLAAAFPGTVPAEHSEGVRRQIIERDGAVAALVRLVEMGPVRHDTAHVLWPSGAHKSERFSSTIVAWGAGQALKNLALSAQAHPVVLSEGGQRALCELHASPDWLENLKAAATLQNLGLGCGQRPEL